MNRRRLLTLGLCVLVPTSTEAATASVSSADPMRFFEGKTEMVSTTKIISQKPFLTHSLGHGRIRDDGILELVQHVEEQGRRNFDRFWHIRRVAPGRFGGSMSEASTPVSIQRFGERYRFRFKLKGDLSVEEWLVPQDDKVVRVVVTIRKYGIAVVHSEGWIRRLS